MNLFQRGLIGGIVCGFVLVGAGGRTALAQVNPVNFRSGIVTGTISGTTLSTIPLFTVPGGMRFVLTDLDWGPSQANTQYQPQLAEGTISVWIQNFTGTIRWAGNAGISIATGQTYFNPNVSQHWTTGLVFEENQTVTLGLSCTFPGGPAPYSGSWSGYLVSNVVTAVEDPAATGGLALRAFPNPAGNRVVLEFTLARPGSTSLAIYDAKGRRIRSLAEGELEAGAHQVTWDGRDARGRHVAAGSYFVQLVTPEETTTKKLMQTR